MGVFKTELKDREGVTHYYESFHIPLDKAFDLAAELVDTFAPLAAIASLDEDSTDMSVLSEMFSDIAKKILKIGGFKKAQTIIAHTTRDNKMMSNFGNLMEAYTGNIAEFVACLRWVIEENFSDFFGEDSLLSGLAQTQ
jgi:hypothetical protein